MAQNEKYSTLEELYMDNYRLVYTYINDFTEHLETARELSSIMWAKVAEDPKRYLNMNKIWLQNYLRVMTRTIAADYFEQERKHKGKLTEDSIDILSDTLYVSSAEEEFFKQEDVRDLKKAQKVLTDEENEIISLRFEAELSAREVGEAFGMTEGALRVKQYRILKKLKAEITSLRNGGK